MTITLCTLAIRFLVSFCPSHNMRAASYQHSLDGRGPTRCTKNFLAFTAPSSRRMDYHYGNDRCVLQVEPREQVLKTMLQWICRQHLSGQRTGVAKLIQKLEQRAV